MSTVTLKDGTKVYVREGWMLVAERRVWTETDV